MSRTQSRTPDVERVLQPARRLCPACGGAMRIRYENRRTLVTLVGTQRLRLKIRRCEAEGCARFRKPYRPEAEGALALPQHEFGLDVIALVGALLDAAGLRLKGRLEKVAGSLERVRSKGGPRARSRGSST